MESRSRSLEAKIFNKAVAYLALRPHSSYELEKKLSAYWVKISDDVEFDKSTVVIKQAIDRLKNLNFLNDSIYIKDLVNSVANSPNPKSPLELKRYLYDRGVSLEVIESILSDLYTSGLQKKAISTLISKLSGRY